ncbi:hypothetical protein ACVW17_005521 [Bradyrhizobium sp. USDA 4473]
MRSALEAAIEQLKQAREMIEAREESRVNLHLDHDTIRPGRRGEVP